MSMEVCRFFSGFSASSRGCKHLSWPLCISTGEGIEHLGFYKPAADKLGRESSKKTNIDLTAPDKCITALSNPYQPGPDSMLLHWHFSLKNFFLQESFLLCSLNAPAHSAKHFAVADSKQNISC